jgi:L-alanine-DL-glutamate epimerase-like enolase superfamily enzyme
MQPVLLETRVEVVEQPLPAANDAALEGFSASIPLCADESCHVKEDLPQLRARYQAVNIKLDKSGGLTGALQLLHTARADGFQVMVGCMVCTSLGIAPAFHLARNADFVDLDGPLWLKQDRPDGVRYEGGWLLPPGADLWGGG